MYVELEVYVWRVWLWVGSKTGGAGPGPRRPTRETNKGVLHSGLFRRLYPELTGLYYPLT